MAMVRRRRDSRAPRQIVGRHPEHHGPAPGAQKYAARARNSDTAHPLDAPLPQSDTEKIASLEKEITNIHETLTRRAINSRNTTDVFGRAFVLPVDEEHKAKVCGAAQLCSCALPHMRGTQPTRRHARPTPRRVRPRTRRAHAAAPTSARSARAP